LQKSDIFGNAYAIEENHGISVNAYAIEEHCDSFKNTSIMGNSIPLKF